jgi:hypothetical protein
MSLLNGMIDTYTPPLACAAVLSGSRRLCDAVLSAVILPLDDIDPVTSSASAARSLALFQITVPVVDSGICDNPISPRSWH